MQRSQNGAKGPQRANLVPSENHIHAYRWCSPDITGVAAMVPYRWTARPSGISLCSENWRDRGAARSENCVEPVDDWRRSCAPSRPAMNSRSLIMERPPAPSRGGATASYLFAPRRWVGDHCVYRKPKPGHSGDEARQGSGVNLWFQSAERGERPAHLCPMTGAFWCRCNRQHRLAGSGADAPRPRRRNGPRTRAGSTRSAVRQSHSAKARPVP